MSLTNRLLVTVIKIEKTVKILMVSHLALPYQIQTVIRVRQLSQLSNLNECWEPQ